MSREFDEKLKAKWKREDEQKQKEYKRSEPLETFEHVAKGREALADNATRLDAEKHPVLRNFNGALISLFAVLRKLEGRLDILENKIDEIYRRVKEDKS